MSNALKALWTKAKALHADEGGADLVEYILVIAAIALPLAAFLIWFRDDIRDWAVQWWYRIKAGEGQAPN